jgi:hypothetical protein
MPDADLAKFASQCAINPPGGYEGPVIASATSITLSHPVHKISGAVAITTINPPYPGFVGHVTLVPTGASTIATGGNIASAVAAGANKIIKLYYDGTNWFPDKA